MEKQKRWIREKQLLYNLKEKSRYWDLNEARDLSQGSMRNKWLRFAQYRGLQIQTMTSDAVQDLAEGNPADQTKTSYKTFLLLCLLLCLRPRITN
jgi:hypothetical protein